MRTFIIIASIMISGCGNSNDQPKQNQDTKSRTDSMKQDWAEYIKHNDEVIQLWGIDLLNHFDTTDILSSPVQIEKRFVGIAKDNLGLDCQKIVIAYKNISAKTIEGIKIRWYCVDAFGDAEFLLNDSGNTIVGEARSDKSLKPGASDSITWIGLKGTAKKVVSAWAYQVAYQDGSVWSILTPKN